MILTLKNDLLTQKHPFCSVQARSGVSMWTERVSRQRDKIPELKQGTEEGAGISGVSSSL